MRRDDTYSRLIPKALIVISKKERKRENECTRMRKSDREYDIKRNVTLSHCVRQIQTVLQYTAKIFHISGSQASHLKILLREKKKKEILSHRLELNCQSDCVLLSSTSKASLSFWRSSSDIASSVLLEKGKKKERERQI